MSEDRGNECLDDFEMLYSGLNIVEFIKRQKPDE